MPRTVLSQQRVSEMIPLNVGHVILFCEGETEKYYFDYFAEIINRKKYNDLSIVIASADGNAQRVLNYAQEYMEQEENRNKYGSYDQYLVFDCDAPKKIEPVIQNALCADYKILLSNYLFETWLLMHFEDLEPFSKLTRKQIYTHLQENLQSPYKKANRGIIREILHNGSVEKAIENAKKLEEAYEAQGCRVSTSIRKMNPYSSVYSFVETLMYEISV